MNDIYKSINYAKNDMSPNLYTVAVRCFTYNQANYIEDTLNGFVIQENDFPVVYTIVDDASTDGERSVLKRWAKDNLDISDKENLWSNRSYGECAVAPLKGKANALFAILLLSENHYQTGKNRKRLDYIAEWADNSKYIAICEGDDYWIDPLKLQKQVYFLDNNPDFGLVYTDFDLVDGRRNHFNSQPDVIKFPDLLVKHISIGTLTVLFRTSIYKTLPGYNHNKNWPLGDFPMWVEISHVSKLKYLNDVTARYRVLKSSASHSQNINKSIDFINACYSIKKFYADLYGIDSRYIYDKYYYERIVRVASRLRSFDVAKQYYSLAKKKNLISWRCRLFYLTAKYPILRKIVSIYIAV